MNLSAWSNTQNPPLSSLKMSQASLQKKNESTLLSIFHCLEKLGYHCDVKILSSEHYGVPEIRRRTIIMATTLNVPIEFPSPTHGTSASKKACKPPVALGDILDNLNDDQGVIHNHDLEFASNLPPIDKKRLLKIPEGCGIRYKRDEQKFLPPRLHLGVDWENIREKRLRQTKYFKLNRSKPSPTITTMQHMYYHPTDPRFLTPREAAKIQSFPNHFIFHGSIKSQWVQIGNAVPPLLGKALGEAVCKMYRKSKRKTPSRQKQKTNLENLRKEAFCY